MQKQKVRVWTLIIILQSLASATFALGATYYVATTGSDSNSGTASQPFRTIQKAADIVQAGDTVNVAPGNYSSVISNTSGTASARIRFVSSTKWGATIIASGTYGWLNNGNYVDIDGFDVTGGSSTRIGILNWVSHTRVTNNWVHDLTSANLCNDPNGGAGIDHAASTAIGNETTGNTINHIGLACTGGTNPGIHGIYQASPNSTVTGNIVHHVKSHGITVYKSGSTVGQVTIKGNVVSNAAVGISSFYGADNKIYNNIAHHNSSRGFWIVDNNSLWANNTAYANGVGLDINAFATGNAIRNNIAYLNSTNMSATGSNTLTTNLVGTNPIFVNATGNDLQLQSNSPAINAGTTVAAIVNDYVGVARPQGSAYDIGAYEYNASGTPLPAPSNYYVATTGSDSNPGTASQPFRTIQKAADVVQAGDTVNVAPGNYSSVISNTSGTASARIRFVSSTKWGATIIASSTYGWLNNGNYVDIDGFDVTGGSSTRIGILNWVSHTRVTNNWVHDLTSANLCNDPNGGAGIEHATSTSVGNETTGNTINHIGLACTGGTNPGIHGIYQGSPNGTVTGNIVHHVKNHGISVYNPSEAVGQVTVKGNVVSNNAVGVSSFYGEDNKIYNNIAHHNSSRGFWIVDNNSLWANNTAYANGVGLDINAFATGNAIRNNIAYLNSTNMSATGSNTLTTNLVGTNPIFVNAAGNDFRLQSNSPAINAGTTVAAIVNDYVGVARPQGSAYDIGAYEYNASGTPLPGPSNLAVIQ